MDAAAFAHSEGIGMPAGVGAKGIHTSSTLNKMAIHRFTISGSISPQKLPFANYISVIGGYLRSAL